MQTSPDLLRFGYNARWGYKLDTETGLYYCQHRYYDSANGRWVTRDPIGCAGGFNVYGYCASHVVSVEDESGLLLGAPAAGAGVAVSEIIGGGSTAAAGIGAGVVVGGVAVGVGLGAR